MYKKISDYRIIGNLQSIALVGLDGSIDWLCLPHIDSPSIFGVLLDDRERDRFSISPDDEYDSMAEYIPDTNILVTRFRTRKGILSTSPFGKWEAVMIVLHPKGDPMNMKDMVPALSTMIPKSGG